MITPAGEECPFYYEDFHRGRSTQECRLIKRNPDSEPWSPDVCYECPVPEILRANGCPNLRLKLTLEKRFLFFQNLEVDAYCTHTERDVDEPRVGCGECHRHRPGADVFELLEEDEI